MAFVVQLKVLFGVGEVRGGALRVADAGLEGSFRLIARTCRIAFASHGAMLDLHKTNSITTLNNETKSATSSLSC
jgi:hypothetical protein